MIFKGLCSIFPTSLYVMENYQNAEIRIFNVFHTIVVKGVHDKQ